MSSTVYSTVLHDRLASIQKGSPLPAIMVRPQPIATLARTSPATAATLVSTSASMNSCVMMRPRLAPSALRTVISQPRIAVRAKTSATSATRLKRGCSGFRSTGTTSSCSGRIASTHAR